MTASEFAHEWVESHWRPEFRYALITGEFKDQQRLDESLEGQELLQALHSDLESKILHALAESRIDAVKAREIIASGGLSGVLYLAESEEQLIEMLTRLCLRGVNAWSLAGSDELDAKGILYANFWHEEGHGLFEDAHI
jgi:hypothetical protein